VTEKMQTITYKGLESVSNNETEISSTVTGLVANGMSQRSKILKLLNEAQQIVDKIKLIV